jgi:hypothetical protein
MNVRFEGNNGHDADVTRCLLMTQSGRLRQPTSEPWDCNSHTESDLGSVAPAQPRLRYLKLPPYEECHHSFAPRATAAARARWKQIALAKWRSRRGLAP